MTADSQSSTTMNRTDLDAFVSARALSADAARAALALTGHTPDRAEWRAFATRVLEGLGILGLAAGAIFFVAANWQDYGVFGRFAILEVALSACVGVALWRAPPHRAGQAALMLALLLSGALLALFGQSYQTGADVHELFFGWAALALPFALAAQSGAVWAAWLCVLNVGLGLYLGLAGSRGFATLDFWWWDSIGTSEAVRALLASLADFVLAALALVIAGTRFAAATPRWLIRFAGSLAFALGTWACLLAIYERGSLHADPSPGERLAVFAAFAALSAATLAGTLRSRRDIFPLALLAAAWIAISTTWIARQMSGDIATFFFITLWLLGLAAVTGTMLMRTLRAWQGDTQALEGGR